MAKLIGIMKLLVYYGALMNVYIPAGQRSVYSVAVLTVCVER